VNVFAGIFKNHCFFLRVLGKTTLDSTIQLTISLC
jgi:hypothetical protein